MNILFLSDCFHDFSTTQILVSKQGRTEASKARRTQILLSWLWTAGGRNILTDSTTKPPCCSQKKTKFSRGGGTNTFFCCEFSKVGGRNVSTSVRPCSWIPFKGSIGFEFCYDYFTIFVFNNILFIISILICWLRSYYYKNVLIIFTDVQQHQ